MITIKQILDMEDLSYFQEKLGLNFQQWADLPITQANAKERWGYCSAEEGKDGKSNS